MDVCLLVWLSATISQKQHVQISLNFPCLLSVECGWSVAVAQFSFGGVAICYVLPVLWITSYFRVMDPLEVCVAVGTAAASLQRRALAI